MTEEVNEQLGEDPEILAAVAKATKCLEDFLHQLSIEIDCAEGDWRDTGGLIEEAHKLIVKHPDWQYHYVGGDDLGIDANYVLFTSKPVSDDDVHVIMDLIINEGAELLGEPEVFHPKCPLCHEEVDLLVGYYPVTITGYVKISADGELEMWLDEDNEPKDIVNDDDVTWHCPHCDAHLFDANETPDLIVFLKEGNYTVDPKPEQEVA